MQCLPAWHIQQHRRLCHVHAVFHRMDCSRHRLHRMHSVCSWDLYCSGRRHSMHCLPSWPIQHSRQPLRQLPCWHLQQRTGRPMPELLGRLIQRRPGD